MAQLLEALTTDLRVRGPSHWHDQTFTQSEESRQLSVIPGIVIMRCCHIERKDKTLLDKHKLLSVLKATFGC